MPEVGLHIVTFVGRGPFIQQHLSQFHVSEHRVWCTKPIFGQSTAVSALQAVRAESFLQSQSSVGEREKRVAYD